MAFVICWLIVRHLKANQIGNLESRLSLRDDEIADYKRKLEGASPDEAAARIAALEASVARLAPRKVSAEQRQAMLPALAPFMGHAVEIATDAAASNTGQISKGLEAAFKSAQWFTTTAIVMGVADPPLTGIGLMVPDPAQLTPPQTAIVAALNAAGIDFDLRVGNTRPPGLHIDQPAASAALILTNPLED